MQKKFILSGLILFLFLGSVLHSSLKISQAASFSGEKTLVLYDASSGTLPNETLMDFTDFPPGAALISYSDGAAVMDTTQSGRDTFAGWISGQAISAGFPTLDRTASVQVNFTMQVDSEMHKNGDRAGFSVIVLDQQAKGVELSFWENEIWAKNDDLTGGLFTHGEGAYFATTAGSTAYQLTLGEDAYLLTANGEQLLTGPVRDYSQWNGFPDPYETPNFLFLGDDSTTSQARVRLQFVSITGSEPVFPTSTDQNMNTSNPAPTALFTPLPNSTSVPTPTTAPTGRDFEFCPSGWLLLALTIPGAILVKQRKRRTDHS